MKKKIPFDAWHRLIQTEDSLIPQWKGLFFWHNYHFRDFCQDFKYDYVIYYDNDTELQEELFNLQETFNMLIELRFYYKDGTIAHRLIQCNDPTKWEGKTVLTNVAKMVKFETRAFEHNENFKIVKIEKKCVLACKTKFKFTSHEWCSGPGYSWSEEWWKMI